MGATSESTEPPQTTKKRSRLPLKQRRLAHHKNGSVVAALAVAAVSSALVAENDPPHGGTLTSSTENSAHVSTLQSTIARLNNENTTLRDSLCKLKQKYDDITTAHEIQESYTTEVHNIIEEKLRHRELQQALHEEKKAMEEIAHFTRQVVLRDMADVGVTSPETVLNSLLEDHRKEQRSLLRLQEKIDAQEVKIAQLQKSEHEAILRTAEVLRQQEAATSSTALDTSRLNAHISYRQYRSHLEVFRCQNKDLKTQVAQLQWQLLHPSELDYDDDERLTPDSPVASAIVEDNTRRLDDLVYHMASLIEQLSSKESELQQKTDQIATFVVNLRTAQSECASNSKRLLEMEEQLRTSEEEKIRLQRRVNKMSAQSTETEARRVTSTGEIPDALVRQNIELKEERELLLQENSLLKKAWQDLPPQPGVASVVDESESHSQSDGWASWGATKARDLSGMFLNPSYIRQTTRSGGTTVPAVSVPSMAGPGSPLARQYADR